jgi:carotenoid cleavage dioxygenase-like enzyme
MNEAHSECLIYAASRLTEGPIARMRLPERASSGTYAWWAPGAAIGGWDS